MTANFFSIFRPAARVNRCNNMEQVRRAEACGERDVVTVEPMDKLQALAPFDEKLGVQEDGNNATRLVAALEHMPLAIVQAAAYISQRALR